ncbi:MAG: hypothetical protein KF681_06300 [Bdellovibrionaceae bacterium]|nr:hypothetical protein [Pseudobdellovibrionaceae bacterium]
MWTKLLLMVFSYLTGKISLPNQPSPIFEIGMDKIRKVALALMVGVIGLIVFTLSLGLILADFFHLSTSQNQLGLTEVSIVGGALLAVSLLTFAFGFRKESWGIQTKPVEPPPREAHDHVSPIADAVNALILDFIEERRADREYRNAQARTQASAFASEPQPGAQKKTTPGTEPSAVDMH